MKDIDETITRRDFFSLVGWGGVAATMGGSAYSFYRFYSPNVLYETQKVFKIGKLSDYQEGLSEKWKKERQVWVVRNERGLYVMISICRHLGCTPNWFQDKNAFLCPCHGSIFSIEGNVLGGPSPRLLWRAAIKIDPTDGQIVVDFNHRQDPDPVSTEQGLRVDEASREVEPFFLKV